MNFYVKFNLYAIKKGVILYEISKEKYLYY